MSDTESDLKRDRANRKRERMERFLDQVHKLTGRTKANFKDSLETYDLVFDFLESNSLVVIDPEHRHNQTLSGDLMEFLTEHCKFTVDARQAKQPYTPFVKLVWYTDEQLAHIDNVVEKNKIATRAIVLQAAFYFGRKPSDAIRLDGHGTEGGLAVAYRAARGDKAKTKKASEPDEVLRRAATEQVAEATVRFRPGSANRMPLNNEQLLLLVTPSDDGPMAVHFAVPAKQYFKTIQRILRTTI